MKDLNKETWVFDIEWKYLEPGQHFDSIRELSKNIVFPKIERYVAIYTEEFEYLKIEQNSITMAGSKKYLKELEKMKQFFSDTPEILSIGIRTGTTTFKVESSWIINAMMSAIDQRDLPFSRRFACNHNEPLKNKSINKKFIRNLYPLFKHLKTHNPNLTNIELYSFLREFIDILGFNFAERYPLSFESEIFKSYFSDI